MPGASGDLTACRGVSSSSAVPAVTSLLFIFRTSSGIKEVFGEMRDGGFKVTRRFTGFWHAVEDSLPRASAAGGPGWPRGAPAGMYAAFRTWRRPPNRPVKPTAEDHRNPQFNKPATEATGDRSLCGIGPTCVPEQTRTGAPGLGNGTLRPDRCKS
ncbi:hypothetical protein Bbelb_203900 [Branchiostoma belcheri]|nr:hypothetical protein Bbelb_203900 [Branchiostoma belcheri]